MPFFLLNLAAIISLIASFIEQYLTHTNKKLADRRGGSGAFGFYFRAPLKETIVKWSALKCDREKVTYRSLYFSQLD